MYTGLAHTHSLIRWIMLALLIFSIIKAYNGWKSHRAYSQGDKKLMLSTLIFSHIQLLTGLILYMISPVVQAAQSDMGAAMKDRILRFWAVEHISVMIIAIIFITIGYALGKRGATDEIKFKKHFTYYLVGLILILVSIPWPFLSTGEGRGWF